MEPAREPAHGKLVRHRTAPFALGYFVGDYEGLDNAGNVFTPLLVAANNGDTANRTDAFFRTAG